MILVTGATRRLGTAVVQNLLGKTSANQIAAFVRDENKASAWKEKGVDIRVGSYDDPASSTKPCRTLKRFYRSPERMKITAFGNTKMSWMPQKRQGFNVSPTLIEH